MPDCYLYDDVPVLRNEAKNGLERYQKYQREDYIPQPHYKRDQAKRLGVMH